VYTVVQPDLFVVCDLQKLDDRGCVGAPELIIEIISASNKKHDIDTKFHLYEEAGVLEYWIVFPNEKVVNVFDLDKTTQKYVFRKIYSDDEAIPSSVLAGLEVDLNKVFADL
jgi:Uma2 family endonuclease